MLEDIFKSQLEGQVYEQLEYFSSFEWNECRSLFFIFWFL